MADNLKLTFIADTHYYSKKLGITGKQYDLRSGSDQKCLAETEAIIDSAFKKIAQSDTDYVLIAGDVSNDGEMVSHIEFREKLRELQKHKKVYLITATHDWCCDENPRRFADNYVYNDVEVMPSYQLYDFYHDFGPSDAIAEYRTHLGTVSYVVQLNDKVRLLALNDDQNGRGRAGFKEPHFEWIDQQLKKAKEDGCMMIGMEHHLLIPHINPIITGGGTCVGDREEVASRLADNGLKYMFVGHSHIQHTDDFVTASGNKITEVNIGSLVGYPAPIVNVTVNNDMTLTYDVDRLESFTLNGEEIDAQQYLSKHCLDLVHNVLECNSRYEFKERMDALGANGESLAKLFFAIRPLMTFINDDTVGQAYNKLKNLGLSRMVDKALIDEYEDVKITDFIDRLVLSAMDGSVKSFDKKSTYYMLVMAIVSIPSKLLKSNNDMKRLIFAADNILTGGKYNNQHDTI